MGGGPHKEHAYLIMPATKGWQLEPELFILCTLITRNWKEGGGGRTHSKLLFLKDAPFSMTHSLDNIKMYTMMSVPFHHTPMTQFTSWLGEATPPPQND